MYRIKHYKKLFYLLMQMTLLLTNTHHAQVSVNIGTDMNVSTDNTNLNFTGLWNNDGLFSGTVINDGSYYPANYGGLITSLQGNGGTLTVVVGSSAVSLINSKYSIAKKWMFEGSSGDDFTLTLNWTSADDNGTDENVSVYRSDDNGNNWSKIASGQVSVSTDSREITFSTNVLSRFTVVRESSGSVAKHYSPVWTGDPYQAMNIYIESATLSGNQLSAGDEIGIFDGNLCVGSVQLTGPVADFLEVKVSKDNPQTSGTDGFSDGSNIQYRLWKASESKEYASVNAEYNPTSPNTDFTSLGTAYVGLDFNSTTTQQIALEADTWHIVSFYIKPENNSMQSILEPLSSSGSLVKMQDESGNAIVRFPNGQWNYGISSWMNSEGYYIYVNDQASLDVTGTQITLPYSVELKANQWNMISYPKSSASSSASVFQSLINSESLVKVQDYRGNSIVQFPNGQWYYGIESLNPGEGYYVYVTEDTELIYNDDSQLSKVNVNPIVKRVPEFYKDIPVSAYQPMNLFVLGLPERIEELGVYSSKDGRFITAAAVSYNPDNEEMGRFAELIIPADNPYTNEIDGITSGETFSLKCNNGVKESSMSVSSGSAISFEKKGTSFLDYKTDIADAKNSVAGFKIGNYPNPFNPSTTISYSIPEASHVSLTVYNLLGEEIASLVNEVQPAGNYKVAFNASELSSGMYLYTIHSGKFHKTKKMILVK